MDFVNMTLSAKSKTLWRQYVLMRRRATLLRSIPGIKDPYTKQLKQQQLEEIERVIREVGRD